MKKIIAVTLIPLLLLFSMQAYAQESIDPLEDAIASPIEKGDEAPFDGYIFTIKAVAEILATQEEMRAQHELDLREQSEICEIEKREIQEQADIDLEAEIQKREVVISIKDREIKQMQDILIEGENDNIWWGVGGMAIGAVLVGSIAAIAIWAP